MEHVTSDENFADANPMAMETANAAYAHRYILSLSCVTLLSGSPCMI